MNRVSKEELAENIDSLASSTDGHFFVAIDGFGGAGKTTVSDFIAGALRNVSIVSLDDYLISKEDNNTPELVGFDRARIVNEVIEPVRNGVLNHGDITIVEGISAMHPDFSDNFNLLVWVGTSIEESTRRAVARDKGKGHEHLRDMWSANDLAYAEKYSVIDRAHFVVIN